MIGRNLQKVLSNHHYTSRVLSRSAAGAEKKNLVYWDPDSGTMDSRALENIDAVVHLAGAGIADSRWTPERKKEIRDSRVRSAELLFTEMEKNHQRIKVFVSASAIGYYGNTGEEWVSETHPPDSGFLGETCSKWEESVRHIESLGIRVVILRIGIVLSSEGGALPEMAKPIRYFAGAPLGSGRQYISWIHLEDLCRMFLHAIENEQMHGVYNAVGPNPVSNKEFTKIIAKVLGRPLWPFSVPAAVMKLILGERAQLVLNGQRVSGEKILSSGFEFKNKNLFSAVQSLLKD